MAMEAQLYTGVDLDILFPRTDKLLSMFDIFKIACTNSLTPLTCDVTPSYRQHTRRFMEYCQVSNIRRTKSQHLEYYRTVLWLSLPNPLKPDIKSSMKM